MTVWILTRAIEYGNSDRLCVWLNKPTRQELGHAAREAGHGEILTYDMGTELMYYSVAHLGGGCWLELDEEEVIQNG